MSITQVYDQNQFCQIITNLAPGQTAEIVIYDSPPPLAQRDIEVRESDHLHRELKIVDFCKLCFEQIKRWFQVLFSSDLPIENATWEVDWTMHGDDILSNIPQGVSHVDIFVGGFDSAQGNQIFTHSDLDKIIPSTSPFYNSSFPNKTYMQKYVELLHANGLKARFSMGGSTAGWCGTCWNALMQPDGVQNCINLLVAYCVKNNFDGIDFDFELWNQLGKKDLRSMKDIASKDSVQAILASKDQDKLNEIVMKFEEQGMLNINDLELLDRIAKELRQQDALTNKEQLALESVVAKLKNKEDQAKDLSIMKEIANKLNGPILNVEDKLALNDIIRKFEWHGILSINDLGLLDRVEKELQQKGVLTVEQQTGLEKIVKNLKDQDALEKNVGKLIGGLQARLPFMDNSLCTNAGFSTWQPHIKNIMDASKSSVTGKPGAQHLNIMSYYDPLTSEEAWVDQWSQWAKSDYGFTPSQISMGMDNVDASAYDIGQSATWAKSRGYSTNYWAWGWDGGNPTKSNDTTNEIWKIYHPTSVYMM